MCTRHSCQAMPVQVNLVHTDNYSSDKEWFIFITEEAQEGDLEHSHELMNVGDIIWQTAFNVIFCPYCGERLPNFREEHYHKAHNYKLI